MDVEKVLVSACLLGVRCRYDASSNPHAEAERLAAQGRAVPACPEMLGGLPAPRPRAEIVGGEGGDVLDGRARVVTEDGGDATPAYLAGARAALTIARSEGIRRAILKDGSPSCGCARIADGSFSGRKRTGEGVTAALLRRDGIAVEAAG